VLTVRTELTDRMLIFGQRHLSTVLAEYSAHYNTRRPHRALRLRPTTPRTDCRGSRPPEDPASTCPRRADQRVRTRSLNELIRRYGRVLVPHRVQAAAQRGAATSPGRPNRSSTCLIGHQL
jgi:hypothetical protein